MKPTGIGLQKMTQGKLKESSIKLIFQKSSQKEFHAENNYAISQKKAIRQKKINL